ncbi:sensor histidine kinase [Acinetobacter sp. 'aerobic (ED)']|uniref:ATP-binding protein n=1 Tax=Acinetobacter sp. 'aerobic (ED)' TaxID=174230 RepID=UPI00192B38E0|nr:sensor histidine kinase [Acinetobacter sp. 'aerobic (ED)']
MDEKYSFFKTRARTIDHLGREQIADCPTAVSELWKNAYDAYARNVALHIFDGEIPVACVVDDGHGMDITEFKNKWLTVGTESKTDGFEIAIEDRNGLPQRPKQGQKGIGRLSSAALGALLLLVSKRKNGKFVAALIDWRLFENPFIYLNDLRIPIKEFENFDEIYNLLPELFDTLMGNIWGESDDHNRNLRLAQAWEKFTQQELKNDITKEDTTKEKIVNTLISEVFFEKHFKVWSVALNEMSHGTAMFIAQLNDDLIYQLSTIPLLDASDTEKLARERFFQTLSNFTDPFCKENESSVKNFEYLVQAWTGAYSKTILGDLIEFDIGKLEDLEHILEGEVDDQGYFKGRVKAFGEWIEDFRVSPKIIHKTRKDTFVGGFHIRVGTFEQQIGSSSLTDEQHAHFIEQAEKYAGFRVYRDGLRIMPYGREDNDYFEIEYRRTKSAGRYFWSNRRMFGRVAITRNDNPNLKDKAGREGFIDNKASKIFREIVQKILLDAADKYFGSKSELRKPTIAAIKETKALEKAEEDKKKLQSKEKSRFRKSIKEKTEPLLQHVKNLENYRNSIGHHLEMSNLDELQLLKKKIDDLNEITQSFSLSPIPTNLGRLADDYRAYRKHELLAKDLVKELINVVNQAILDSKDRSDFEKISEIYRSKLSSVNNKITHLASQGKSMLSKQSNELDDLIKTCRQQFKVLGESIIEDVKLQRITIEDALQKLEEGQEIIQVDNAQKLTPYITALERINEQIDLEGVAIHSLNESEKYKSELSRFYSLAQLGITVEIIGHELQSLDKTVTGNLKLLAKEDLTDKQKNILQVITDTHSSLINKLQFLSPLKLSGEQIVREITGKEIYNYINDYFSEYFESQNIKLDVSSDFLKIRIMDNVSRIMPVFINLINNAQYWTQFSEQTRKILLDVRNGEVIIADSGPGVELDDINSLFSLFFTRKQRGGRGVGLYLCKQNLQASGHQIRYETIDNKKLLSGANFVIQFKGMGNH